MPGAEITDEVGETDKQEIIIQRDKWFDRTQTGCYGSITGGRGGGNDGSQEGFLEEVTSKLRPIGQVGTNQNKGEWVGGEGPRLIFIESPTPSQCLAQRGSVS